ncbi:hypothetical protein SDC9_145165 [bioreactor metagenome]|uniref:Uncharacterized protein n=1 Tax=bioreactor metagenome TaxID=1076179 RepID=A0A645E7S0_9ZZZZ
MYVVDATTQKFSSQKLVESALGREVKGLYYTMLSRKDICDNASFVKYRKVLLAYTRIDVPEFLMSSPETPVLGMVDGEPVFSDDVPEEERFRLSVIGDVIKGEDEYIKRMKEVFGGLIPRYDSRDLEKWIESLTKNMNNDNREHLSKLFWASDPAHDEYHGIVFSPKDAFPFLSEKMKSYYKSFKKRIG